MNQSNTATGTYRFSDILVDANAHTLFRGNQACPIEPKAFAVLLQLLCHPGEVVTKEALLDSVWGHRCVTPNVLSRVITQIRHALGDAAHQPLYIETVPTLGYRFIADLHCSDCSTPVLDCPAFLIKSDPVQQAALLEEMKNMLAILDNQQGRYPALSHHLNTLVSIFGDKPSGMALYEMALEYGLEMLCSQELDLPWRVAGWPLLHGGNDEDSVKPSQ